MGTAVDADRVAEAAHQVVREHDPRAVPIPEFLGACFDAGLSWVHFPEGFGGLGVSRGMQAVADRILQGAGKLGIDARTATLSAEQATACLLAGALSQGLIRHHAFDDQVARLFARLTYPLCRQLMTDPGLLGDAEHPVRGLLDALCWALDANPASCPEDEGLRTAAVDALSNLLGDMHEPEQAFVKALDAIRGPVDATVARARLARRRLVQSVEGRERLVVARRESDLALARLEPGRRVLPEVRDCAVWSK